MNATSSLRDIANTLVLLGAGKMGGALLDGWAGCGLDPAKLIVFEPQPSAKIERYIARGLRLNPPQPSANAAAVILAVKPQIAPEVLASLAPLLGPSTVVVSIMAGRSLAFLRSALPRDVAIVRSMPNTAAAIGRGMTVAVANARVTPGQRDLAHRLLAATGAVEWITDETLMDAVTAVSGSGPAYVFLLAESLARAGVAAGLPPHLADALARATIAGSGELLHRSTEAVAALRQNVTSPGGTTAAALDVLTAPDGLFALMQRAVLAAAKRSRELGS